MTLHLPSLRKPPGALWRFGSASIMGLVGLLSKGFLYGFNRVETEGLEDFLKILDSRKGSGRKRGLVTACNHISVLDDPVMWGVLPFRYAFDPWSLRWGLGAQDICFTNSVSSNFFSLGQVLPTYRLKHSPQGGLFQPSIAEAVHLLSAAPSKTTAPESPSSESESPPHPHSHLSWLHVFPEGCVHQSPVSSLRYFKWGISRLILESDPTPDFLPMFMDGMQRIMPENRSFPRFLPRVGQRVRIAFGNKVDVERVFGDQIERWRRIAHLVQQQPVVEDNTDGGGDSDADSARKLGDRTKGGVALGAGEVAKDIGVWKEAVDIRIEVARRVRAEVGNLRRSLGYPDDDESLGLAGSWARERLEKLSKGEEENRLTRKL